MPQRHKPRVFGVVGVNAPHIPHWMLWLHPDIVDAALSEGRTFVADPKVDPILQMRQVYSPDMYVLLFEDGQVADKALDRDPSETIRNSYCKDLMTSAEWGKMPAEVANMEYYGKPIPDQLPGRDVLNASELDFTRSGSRAPASRLQSTGTATFHVTGRPASTSTNYPCAILMISGEHDVVLRPSMAAGMDADVPDLERHVIPDCWHWTPEEKPAELNRLTVSFLTRRFPSRR
jgi:pimeloyl-ACP methyl ester carboxylesterase